jgi:hypothetical protein
MKRILRSVSEQGSFELKLGYLMPVFIVLAILINTQIANASPLGVRQFASVPIHPSEYADYSRDALDLQFAPIDPSIIEDIHLDNAPDTESDDQLPEVPLGASATPQLQNTSTPQPSATFIISLPTLPIPTLPPLLPTLPPAVPTVLSIVPTAVAPIIDLLPTVVPCLSILC